MKKFVLKLDLHDDKDKRKALKTVSALAGIDSISMDMKGKQLTVIGTVDPISVVSKLRKFWAADIILVGPAKEPEKKEEAKKEEPKKEEDPKKEDPKKEAEAKKEEEPKKEEKKKDPEPVVGFTPYRLPYYYPENGIMPYRPPYPPMNGIMPYRPPYAPVNGIMPYRPSYPPASTFYDAHHSVEDNPTGCVIS